MGRNAVFGDAERIQIIGPCGAGKSTLARQLGGILGLPVIHIDQMLWRSGWVQAPEDETLSEARAAMAAPQWIADGNYPTKHHMLAARVEHVVHLDYSRRVHVGRVLWRAASTHGRVRADMAPGCPERLEAEFLRYTWRFRRDVSPQLRETVRELGVAHHTLTHPRQTRALLGRLR